MSRGEVGSFAAIVGEIVELRLTTIVIAEELPVAFAHGEIRERLKEGGRGRFSIGWTAPEEGGSTRRCALSQEDSREVFTIEIRAFGRADLGD